MAETTSTKTSKAAEKAAAEGNAASVDAAGVRDKVQMLSLRADGTPDQHNPELIGDKDATLAATREQFATQAVSSVDVRQAETSDVDDAPQDPSIEAAADEHQQVAEQAEKTADAVVDQLHQG